MIKLGFLGGGDGSIAGRVHLIASQMDGCFEVVGGVFSQDEKRSKKSAKTFQVKHFQTIEEMCSAVDIVVVLTPTPMHYHNLLELSKYDVGVICDKPLASNTKEAKKIATIYKDRFLVVTHNYTGYPMVRELQALIKQRTFGTIKNIIVNMPQESFFRPPKSIKYPQKWRLSDGVVPTIALDLGVHVYNMASFLLQKSPKRAFVEANKFSKYNVIDDMKIWIDYGDDLKGSFWISKTALGNANALSIEIYGATASAKWTHENPEELVIAYNNGKKAIINRSCDLIEAGKKRYNRMTPGHPAGFIEAFANLYADIASLYRGEKNQYIADVEHAVESLEFFELAMQSYEKGAWIATD